MSYRGPTEGEIERLKEYEAESVLPVGIKVRLGKGGPLTSVLHVRGYADGRPVVRRWSNRKQSWRYRVMHAYDFFLHAQGGQLEIWEEA